ncbi:hypothetical protein V8C26DRAFT_412679 [Trichoderma gracile]
MSKTPIVPSRSPSILGRPSPHRSGGCAALFPCDSVALVLANSSDARWSRLTAVAVFHRELLFIGSQSSPARRFAAPLIGLCRPFPPSARTRLLSSIASLVSLKRAESWLHSIAKQDLLKHARLSHHESLLVQLSSH